MIPSVPNTKYWAIVAAEKIRLTEEPKCVLTSKTENLTILPDVNTLGKECVNNMTANPIVSKDLLIKYGTEGLRRMIGFAESSRGGSPNGVTKEIMRTYYTDETLEFGMHKGKRVGDVLMDSPEYLLYLHKRNADFNIVKADGNLLF